MNPMNPLSDPHQYSTKHPASTFSRLKQLIIFFLLVVGVIPGLVGFFAIYKTSKRELMASKGEYFMQVASLTAYHVESILEEKLEDINRLARMPMIRNIITFSSSEAVKETETLRKIIMPELAKNYFIANIYNTEGEIVFSSDLGNQILDREFGNFQRELVGAGDKVYISDIYEAPSSDRPYYIEVYATVKDDAGTRIGAIQVRYAIDQLFDTITNVMIGDTGHANLVTSAGEIIICPIFAPKSHHARRKLIKSISTGSPGWTIGVDDAHGSTGSIIGFSPVKINSDQLSPASFGGKSWYIFTRQEPHETFEPLEKFHNLAIIYATCLTTLAIIMGLFAWRQILKAQKAHQAEVVYKEKELSIKQLMASFEQLMAGPLLEFSKWIDDMETNGRQQRLTPESLATVKKHLLGIESVIQHLAYYTQTEKFDMRPVELKKIVEDSLLMLGFMIDNKKIKLKLDQPDTPVMLMGEARLLSIIIMNVVLNAIHAVNENGYINVSVKKSDGWGVVTVRDNGTGIHKDEIKKIFDPFFTTKRGHKGYGLGLSVSRGIIEKHGGRFRIESSLGDGTEVIVQLKLAPENTIA